MLEPLRKGMVRRMANERRAGKLSCFESAVLAALTLLGMEVEQAIAYAAIFGGPTD